MIDRNKLVARIGLCVLALALGACALSGTPGQRQERWVTAWGASPVAPIANSTALNNQTVRLIVRPTIDGDQVRVRIGNTFGARELQVGAASIAVQDNGATVATDSLRALSFSGRNSVIVPPGAVVLSDPVNLSISGQKSLAVSLHLPQDGILPSAHPGANQTSYVSTTGNFVADASGTAFGTAIQSWPLLTAIEVQSRAIERVVVTFGDSITDGFKSTVDANRRWPDYLAARLKAAGKNVAVVNQGISGNRLLHDALGAQPRFGQNALARFDRDVLAVSGVTHATVMIGINDIGMGGPARNPAEAVNAEDIIAGYRQLIARAHARGIKIIGATLTPFGDAGYYSAEGEQKRQAVNQWIRTGGAFDAVIDFDAALRDPAKPTHMRPNYDSGDHLHPGDAGYQAMANAVELKFFD